MMYSGKKFLLFSLLGILLGYLFHRLTLLYDSYTGNSLDKWTHLLMEGQDEVLQSPWNVSFTGKSSACLLYTSPSPRDKRQSRMPSSA